MSASLSSCTCSQRGTWVGVEEDVSDAEAVTSESPSGAEDGEGGLDVNSDSMSRGNSKVGMSWEERGCSLLSDPMGSLVHLQTLLLEEHNPCPDSLGVGNKRGRDVETLLAPLPGNGSVHWGELHCLAGLPGSP